MEVIGHRGAMGLAPENSLQSFEAALSGGVRWVELDVRVTSDNQLVVIHDDNLKRLAGDGRKVADSTLAQLQQVTLASGGHVEALSTILDALTGRAKLNIELKVPNAARAVVDEITSRKIKPDDVLLSSFDWQALKAVKHATSSLPIAKIRRWWPFVTTGQIARYNIQAVCLRQNWLQKRVVRRLQKQGLDVYAYTVDEPTQLKHAQEQGLWAVVSNDPVTAQQSLRKKT